MKRTLIFLLILSFLLSACVTTNPLAAETTPISDLPTPLVAVSQAPDVETAALAYLEAYKAEDYAAMYGLLSTLTRDAVSFEDFQQKHRSAAIAMTLQSTDYAILSNMVNPASAQVSYEVLYTTALLGVIDRSTIMNLALEDGSWRVKWDASMILPELQGGNTLEIYYEVPARGNIYDSFAYPMVAHDDAVAVGVVPGQIDPETEDGMINFLSRLTSLSYEQIYDKYKFAGADWYVPITDLSASQAEENASRLQAYPGLIISPFRTRYYYDGGLGPHVIGYVLSISPEELETYQRNGYAGDEKIGATGLEAWGESYLSGKHGASLYVRDPQGGIVTMLAKADAQPAASIYSTIDSGLQYNLQNSMGEFRGAIVVLERDTGRVLAMVSNPSFDPNLFEPTNANSLILGDVLSDTRLPLYNRAAQGVYPPGSVFKIVTMAAALETGVFTPEYPYYCDDTWNELGGITLYDWTYAKGFGASGLLSLKDGLMRSCNPWFYHIGFTLWNDGYESAIADVAKGFGLGSPTGIEIPEFEGKLEIPDNISQNVQMAIGQFTLQVSPLQVANFVAAVGNGGTLFRPSVVDKIVPISGGDPIYSFTPQALSQLPVSPANLTAIQEAMVNVIRSPRGTANYILKGNTHKIAGKTGTAENPAGDSHAWFAGYTFDENPNKPDIAIAIILENAGEGSAMAAPLFRRVVQLYFSNNTDPGGTMPWEETPYILAEETPEP